MCDPLTTWNAVCREVFLSGMTLYFPCSVPKVTTSFRLVRNMHMAMFGMRK